MWSSPIGRPRSACTACKRQKLRCSGDRPVCKRCTRLRRNCLYSNESPSGRGPQAEPRSQPTASSLSEGPSTCLHARRPQRSRPVRDTVVQADDMYLGISKSLVLTLVNLFFDTAYNASLLLHKPSFLESLEAGSASPHVVLSVCAWSANFYRDRHGTYSLREHDFMIEWANRAGKLVFENVQKCCEDNIVTFCVLGLFWYTQGSWRLCYLYKGNALLCLHIRGLTPSGEHNELQLELQRRRLWALYLMQCALGEPLVLFDQVVDMQQLPLPWPESDFTIGSARGRKVTLVSDYSNGGIYGELINVFTLWSSVLSHIKNPNCSIRDSLAGIYALDDDLSQWWSRLPPELRLEPSTMSAVPREELSRMLLLNLIYHQSICALHASIVPLFSWSFVDDTFLAARQASAQRAFDHACAASELMRCALKVHSTLTPAHTFIAYAAYSGCAIQMPFLWCANLVRRQWVIENVQANIRVISALAQHWKFAALLKLHVACLYKMHQQHAATSILEDEPKNADIHKLVNFSVNAAHARISILGFVEILRTRGKGFVNAGDESTNLGMEESVAPEHPGTAQDDHSEASHRDYEESERSVDGQRSILTPTLSNVLSLKSISPDTNLQGPPTDPRLPSPQANDVHHRGRHGNTLETGTRDVLLTPSDREQRADEVVLDMVHPFFEPAMLDLSHNTFTDLNREELDSLALEDFDLGDWMAGASSFSGGEESYSAVG